MPNQPEWDSRLKLCHQNSLRMLEAAETAATEEGKAELLRLSMEWLKMAAEITKLLPVL